MTQLEYKVNSKQTEKNFDILPTGKYKAIVKASDLVTNSMTYQIIEGEFKGRKVFTEAISQKELNSLYMAVGMLKINGSSQLHGIPMTIDIGINVSTKSKKFKKGE